MPRRLSDHVGHLFPTTAVGAYPRPRWNTFDLGGEDIRVALRRGDFAEAFSDGVRAMIGDQIDAGLDLPTDGHLWYDRHEGFISSFLLYPSYHLDGIEVLPAPNHAIPGMGREGAAAFEGTWNEVVVEGAVGRGTMHLADLWTAARRVSPRTVKFCSGMGPANLGGWLTDKHYGDKKALYRTSPMPTTPSSATPSRPGSRCSSSTTSASRCTRRRTTRSSSRPSTARSRASTPCACSTSATSAAAHRSASPPTPGSTSWSRTSSTSTRWSTRSPRPDSPEADAALWSRYPSDKGLGVGCIDIKRLVVETPDAVVAGVRKILEHVPAERVHLTTDCGMFSLPRPLARAKLVSMTQAAEQLRAEA